MKKNLRKRSQPRKKTVASRSRKKALPKCLVAEKCKNLFDLTNDMIHIFKAEGGILETNPSWKQVLEYREEDLAHLTVFNLLHSRDKKDSEEIFLAVLRDGKPRKFQATLLGKSGKEVMVEGTVSRLLCEDRPFALSAVFHDVTQYRNYENLKDEFISTVSHELRTPLTVVREAISQLKDQLFGPVPEKQQVLLELALQNSDRLARIINELLDVSKLEAGKMQLHRRLCDLVKVTRSVVMNFDAIVKRKSLEILTDFNLEKIAIYVDCEKYIQVLTNLISNAVKFTERGHVKVQLRVLKGFVECRVSDTGKGISKEDLPNAFQKFRQFGRDVGPGDRGTGLGLSICKKLVELHHGRIRIESVPMKGTTVTFLLPQYTRRDLFKESIGHAMSQCLEDKSTLSIIIFDILDFEALEEKIGTTRVGRIVLDMERIVNKALRRVADVAIRDAKAILVLLPDTKKENAFIVLGRLSQLLEDYLAREQKMPKVEVHSRVVCFPEEAETLEAVLDKIYT